MIQVAEGELGIVELDERWRELTVDIAHVHHSPSYCSMKVQGGGRFATKISELPIRLLKKYSTQPSSLTQLGLSDPAELSSASRMGVSNLSVGEARVAT